MKGIFIRIIKFYQKRISPHFPPCCRYYPTCSQYALEAIERFGVIKGGYLALKRLLKCNRLFKGGVDFVPEKFSFFNFRK